jgi:hypothetical protein
MLRLSDTLAPGRAVAVATAVVRAASVAASIASVDVPVLGGHGNIPSVREDERGSRGGGSREGDADSGAATCSA